MERREGKWERGGIKGGKLGGGDESRYPLWAGRGEKAKKGPNAKEGREIRKYFARRTNQPVLGARLVRTYTSRMSGTLRLENGSDAGKRGKKNTKGSGGAMNKRGQNRRFE